MGKTTYYACDFKGCSSKSGVASDGTPPPGWANLFVTGDLRLPGVARYTREVWLCGAHTNHLLGELVPETSAT